jgi:hypothetical protein
MARRRELFPRLGRLLFLEPQWPNQSELARRLETTPSAIETWIHWLAFHRAIRFESGRIEADRPRLLTLLAAARTANLRPAPPFTTTRSTAQIQELLHEQQVPHVFSFFTAANQWAFYEPRDDCHLYVDRGRMGVLRRLLGQREPPRRHPTTVQAYLEPVATIQATQRDGLPITGIFETVVDLRAHPEGGAHAAFLEKNVLPRLRRTDGSERPTLGPDQ